jgi:hypothetical protein
MLVTYALRNKLRVGIYILSKIAPETRGNDKETGGNTQRDN